jgi:aryl-alcohol dehydrogenase-like predicted oxidoreductase
VRTKFDIYVLLQVHDMEFAPNLDIIINETLPALQKVKDSGKAKFIGIGRDGCAPPLYYDGQI